MATQHAELNAAKLSLRKLKPWFASLIVAGAVIWWVYRGSPSLQVTADSLILGVIGLLLVAISMSKRGGKVAILIGIALSATALGWIGAEVTPAWPSVIWTFDDVAAGSIVVAGSVGYLVSEVREMFRRIHWLPASIVLLFVLAWLFLVIHLSGASAIA